MNSGAVKAIARAWVNGYAVKTRGYQGAFFTGSVCDVGDSDQMSEFSDVDLVMVWEKTPENIPRGKLLYDGVIFDISHITFDDLGTHGSILSNYHRAYHFSRENVLHDPTGRLSLLQNMVSAEFAHPEWIRKRIDDAVRHDNNYLDRCQELYESSAPLSNQAGIAAFAAGIMVHVILAAALRNPTVRKRYVAARSVLSDRGNIGYYQRLLDFLGCRDMSKPHVIAHLASLGETFDAAVEYFSTPYMFASDIGSAGRTIAIGGSQDLINRGLHREAVFYMVATYSRCLHVLRVDAPERVFVRHEANLRKFLSDLGLGSKDQRLQRVEEIRSELPTLTVAAEGIAGL